ncbi:PE-PGRS family protein [Melittangium boletus]|uniref:PE-PGRS family protein n=1 Tax=Melittangium boletus DSM 14713 TaxID=1294270 RepID=A0A250IPC9_9BACT|nr:PE-PGRS family protein [Melittangium boletus]ATB33605.1 PE-PGRS family protein [Melittangium boletus DSM 14713]
MRLRCFLRSFSLGGLLLLPAVSPALARTVNVSSVAQLQTALASARAGDAIELAPGTYDVKTNLTCSAAGTAEQPIVVRAQSRMGARIRFDASEGFKVSGPHWTFEGLDVEGVCASDSACEHAFHVTGRAHDFVLRESRVRDFNAQLKVNASLINGVWEIPHRGLVERNELADTRPRVTSNPVTKLNIDTGDGWVVRDNFLHDFHKNGGNAISYGAFMKSGGREGVFERNLVLCTRDLATGGTRIGLSFGGGGTANAFCAPAFDASVPCDPEHSGGVMRNNVIVNCSDVGIYLNRARSTQVLFNTLISTAGVDFRYASTSGEAHGNLLSSAIRARDSATFDAGTNLTQVSAATFEGWYVAPLQGNLTLEGSVSSLLGAAGAHAQVTDDWCGRPRPASGPFTLGALEHSLGNCAGWPGDAGGGPGEADAGTGPGPDAGTGASADAGVGGEDAGASDEPAQATGCGCTSAPGALSTLGLAALMMIRWRRRVE